MPATAPKMITTPMAISQDMRAKTTPIGPYFLSYEVTIPEKMTEKTASMPTQKTAVATAQGNRAQLIMICREWFQHPQGALPAYEWDFGDVNPPVRSLGDVLRDIAGGTQP